MFRFAFAVSFATVCALSTLPAAAQQAAPTQAGSTAVTTTPDGKTCKKVYVQKKSARTGNYVHVPRQKCS